MYREHNIKILKQWYDHRNALKVAFFKVCQFRWAHVFISPTPEVGICIICHPSGEHWSNDGSLEAEQETH